MMKTKTLALLAAIVLLALPLRAEDLTWSRFNLNFSVPDGGFVTMNTPTYFEEQWDEMSLTIRLYGKSEEKDVYTSSLLRKAQDFNMYEVKKGKVKVKGFDGYQVEGIMPDGTRGLLVNLVSKKSDLVVQITVNYLFGMRETVDDLVKSFAENKDQKAHHEKKQQKVQGKKSPKQADGLSKKERGRLRKEQQQRDKEQELQEQRRRGEIHDI